MVIEGTSTTVADLILRMSAQETELSLLRQEMVAMKQFVGMMPPTPATPPTPPTPPRAPLDGWYDGGQEAPYSTSCESHGLTCSEYANHVHNGDVDSSTKMAAIVQGLGMDLCPDLYCGGRYGDGASVPVVDFYGGSSCVTACHFSWSNRSLSTFNCSNVPPVGWNKHRLCYCSAADGAWQSSRMANLLAGTWSVTYDGWPQDTTEQLSISCSGQWTLNSFTHGTLVTQWDQLQLHCATGERPAQWYLPNWGSSVAKHECGWMENSSSIRVYHYYQHCATHPSDCPLRLEYGHTPTDGYWGLMTGRLLDKLECI